MSQIVIREAHEGDVPAIRNAHRRSIVDLASNDYPPEVIVEWGVDQSPEAVQRHKDAVRSGVELVWVAEIAGKIEGFSTLVPAGNELRAVYVTGVAAKRGIGSKLLQALENKARKLGLKKLELHSSVTARAFYEKHGYRNLGKATHTMRTGRTMECFEMEKYLKR